MSKPTKTYKREIASVQLVLHWMLVMGIVYVAINQNDRDLSDLVTLATGLAVWVYGFAAAAFGMDSWAKQVQPQLPPQQRPQKVFDE
jgi:hypothetical protein